MSVSDRSVPGDSSRGLSRYDLVLAVIPAAFVLAVVVAELFGVPVRESLLAAAGVGGLAVVDAVFVNPPSAE